MVPEFNIEQVASFQIFVRDNKPKMNAYYPFLSQEQIMLKLRQRWKQLDESKRQPYCKLVLSRKKVKTVKVKVVKITRPRIPKGKQTGAFKNVSMARNYDNFGFDYSGDSYISSDYELDTVNEHSPFVCNKLAIDSLSSGLCPATNKPTGNVKKGGVRKTDESGTVGLQYAPRVRSESMDDFKPGILQASCKKRPNFQGHVSFSAVTETAANRSSCEFDEEDIYEDINEDIDDDVLNIESNRNTKMNTSDGNTFRDKSVAAEMPHGTNLQKVEDRSWMPFTPGNLTSQFSPAVGELGLQETKKRKLNVKTTEINTPVTSSESTSCRFKRSRRNMPPANVCLNLDGGSLLVNSTTESNKKSEIVSEFCRNKTFSAKNNMTYVETKGQSFFSESPNLLPEVKVQSCVYDSGDVLKHAKDELHLSSFMEGANGNFKQGQRSKQLKNKADVNKNNLSVKSCMQALDCGTNEGFTRFSRRAITLSHQLPEFDSPQSTKSRVQSTGTKSCVQSTATKSRVQSTGTKSRVQSSGTKSRVQSTATKSRVQSTATKSRVQSTGTKSRVQSTATKSRVQSTGTKSSVQSTATKSSVQSTGKKSHVQPTDTKSHVQSTGTKSRVQSTGPISRVQSTGIKSYVQSTGTKSLVQSTGPISRVQSTGTKSRVQSTGTKSRVQSTGTKSHVQSTGTKSHVQPTDTKCRVQSTNTKSCVQSTGTKSYVQTTGLKNDSSDEACLETSTVKISQKVTWGFSGKDAHWKDDDSFNISDGTSDSNFGDKSAFYQDGTGRKDVSHTCKETVFDDEADFKTNTRKKSEMNTNLFGRESRICKRKVDSDEENDNEFDDTDGCYTNEIVSTRPCQLRKGMDSAVDAYLVKNTMKKYDKLPFDFCERKSNIHKGNVGKNDKASGNKFDDKDSCFRHIVHSVPYETGKKTDSTIATYLNKSRMKKCEKISQKKCDNHRKIADSSDEENTLEVSDRDSFFRDDVDSNAHHNRSKENNIEACSKRSMLKKAGRTISDLTRKGIYNHSEDADILKACNDDKKFDSVVDDCENDIGKKVTSIKSINTLLRKNDSHSHSENIQANRITDHLAVYANNTTERNSEISKGRRLGKCEQIQHVMVINNKIRQVGDKTFVKHGSDMEVVEVVEHGNSETKNGFPRKDSKSVLKQKNKPRLQNQKKSAKTQKSTSSNRVLGNNKDQKSHANSSDNYSIENLCLPSGSLKYKIFQHESHLKNSSTQHAHKLPGDQSPARKETPNYEVKKSKHPSDFSSGSTDRVQRRLFSDMDCRKTSGIDRSKKFKMENKNIPITDCINESQVSWKAEDVFNSDMSNNSAGSDTDEDEDKHQDEFLANMADQTTTALLQAIDRLRSLTSPQVNLAEECLPDGDPSELPEPEDNVSKHTVRVIIM
ncbi:hypothetical protein BsWGS_27517 [Bradybaena similaris]